MTKLTSTQQAVVTAYGKFLTAGTTYGNALQNAAAELGETPCLTLLQELAKVHAKHYGCNIALKNDGHPVFHTGAESTRETRHAAAQKSWSRNVAVHFSKSDKRTVNKVDDVARLLKAYAKLSKAEQKRFLASI